MEATKEASRERVLRVVKEYKGIWTEMNPNSAIDIPIPETPEDIRAFIEGMEQQIEQLKRDKREKAEKAEQDMLEAKKLHDLLNKEKSVRSVVPANPDKKVMELMENIREIFGREIDYESAESLLLTVGGNIMNAIDAYSSNSN